MYDQKISVIIPVYNVEKYLKQCIESVINQTYRNLEIILVNDGSLDNSPRICDEYSEGDSRIKVVHKRNGGLSSARNEGIKESTGDYLIFLDSDDYWDSSVCIENLVIQINEYQSDVICWGYKKLYEDTNKIKNISMNINRSLLIGKEKDEAFDLLIKNDCYIASAWNKIIKRDLFEKNDLYFIEGIFSEDVDWCARLAVYAKSFDFYNDNFLIYRQRAGSITKTITEKNIADLTNNFILCYNLLDNIKNKKFKIAYFGYLASQYSNLMIILCFIDRKIRCKYIEKVQRYKYVLKYGSNFRTKIINIFTYIVGISITIDLVGYIVKLNKFYKTINT